MRGGHFAPLNKSALKNIFKGVNAALSTLCHWTVGPLEFCKKHHGFAMVEAQLLTLTKSLSYSAVGDLGAKWSS